MAGPRCKVFLNGIVGGLTKALETVLISDQFMEGVEAPVREDWLQRLANCDLAVYSGEAEMLPPGGLVGIVLEMEKYNLVTDEVWYVLRKPQ